MLWVSCSQRYLARALTERGFSASQKPIGWLLRRLGFSLQANSKTQGGTHHPDRNAQFESINAQVQAFQAAGHPPQACQRLRQWNLVWGFSCQAVIADLLA